MGQGYDGRVDVRIEQRGDRGVVAYVTIENSAKLNTLNSGLMNAFAETIRDLGRRQDLRVVVVTGGGEKAFIGGADIRELAELDPIVGKAFIEKVHTSCRVLRELPVPVIGRIQGYALGAGLEVAAACDLRIAADKAVFGMPEVCIGIPSVVEAALLPGLIGWGRTRQMLMLGENIGAAEALEWGLVERVVPMAELDAAVEQWVAKLVANGQNALTVQKKLILDWEVLPMDQAIAAGIPALAGSFTSDEPKAFMKAFLERPRRRDVA
ncbi:enoyl-CoA hydratase [Roseomonas sp. JC162]|uniref:Enoyl-CoA hydratase n=1 Tax=Neoroseomonas marina TaxID=1232220 RepID=A0A848EJE3_9PROT|nr:enoyl-CoA hydratase [Neoroseomonas marina]NMJ43508.1 enoyl-CoA hydratase [Neoroseomonas marina]